MVSWFNITFIQICREGQRQQIWETSVLKPWKISTKLTAWYWQQQPRVSGLTMTFCQIKVFCGYIFSPPSHNLSTDTQGLEIPLSNYCKHTSQYILKAARSQFTLIFQKYAPSAEFCCLTSILENCANRIFTVNRHQQLPGNLANNKWGQISHVISGLLRLIEVTAPVLP